MRNAIAFSAAAMMFAITAPAHATGVIKCNAGPQSSWKSSAVLTAKLNKEGWQVRKAKVDGGCYEVYGTTPKGERVEAYFHPVTLENLFIGRRGQVIFRKQGY
jgi:hypothetical protein